MHFQEKSLNMDSGGLKVTCRILVNNGNCELAQGETTTLAFHVILDRFYNILCNFLVNC